MLKKIIAIDGGGTKTDTLLCNEKGQVLARFIGPPSSPTSLSLGRAKELLNSTITTLLAHHGGLEGEYAAVFAGISGGGLATNQKELEAFFRDLLPNAKAISNGSDSINAISAAIGSEDGIVAICGTGTSVFARIGGIMKQVAGWGYLLGDEGSGYDLGRKALQGALRAFDGRGGKTLLTTLCEKKLGKPVEEAIPLLYEGGRPAIAAFAPCLLQAASLGDPIAVKLRTTAAWGLYEAIEIAGKKLAHSPKPVVMAGSIWQNKDFKEQIALWLGEGYRLLSAPYPPVYGAVIEGAKMAHILIDSRFLENFAQTFC